MSTSLAEQLQKLRRPQTTLLLQDKKRPSLLFSPKEAANLDRETVFNIGINGLGDLIKLSEVFKEYETNLFSPSSITLERSVTDAQVNKKLDAIINKFLINLAPYFLLNSAHKALEWLIYRFHIHEFNKDQFIMLILPYHETRMFVRALQLIDLTNSNDRWHWLEPLQKPGVPLSSITLVNRVVHDEGLLKLLCSHVITATNINIETETSTGALSSLYAFYTMAIVGAIDVKKLSQVHVNHLLPTLLKGMSSPIVDFAASNCMILVKLSYHLQLENTTMEHLLLKALKNPQLKNQVMLLLLILYESPYNQQFSANVSKKLLLTVSKQSLTWLCEEINRIHKLQVNTSKFLVPLFESAVNFILTNDNTDDDDENNKLQVERVRNMTTKLLKQVELEENSLEIILNAALKRPSQLKIISPTAKEFLIKLYTTLESKYPEQFDEYLKNLMKQSGNRERKEALQFLMSCGNSGIKNTRGSLNILDGLNHYNGEQRIIALESLSNNLHKIMADMSESFKAVVKEALLARFNDDDERVCKVILTNFSLDSLRNLFPPDILINKLMILLARGHTEKRRVLAEPALKLLLQLCADGDYQVDDNNDTNIFIATLPYLFPSHNSEVEIAMFILRSEFAKKNKYLAAVKDDVMANPSPPDAESIGSASFHNILNWKLLPPTANILNSMKLSYDNSGGGDATSLFFNLILLGSVCRVPVGSLEAHVAREVIQMSAKMMKQYHSVRSLPNCNQLNGDKIQDALKLTSQGSLPLQAGTYVLEMVHRRLNLQTNSVIDFENNYEHTQLIIGLLEILFDGMRSSRRRAHYSWCLRIFFQRHCPTARDMLRFLAQFFIKPVKAQTSLHCLKIADAIFKIESNKELIKWIFNDEIFVVNLLVALSRSNKACRDAALDILMQITSCESGKGCPRLLLELAERSAEISTDSQQVAIILYTLLSPDPDVRHQLKEDIRGELEKTREFLMNIILENNLPVHAKSQLLQVLVHVNGSKIVEQLTTIGHKLLIELNDDESDKIFGKIMLGNILERFNSTTVNALRVEKVWEFFEAAVNNHRIGIPIDGEKTQTQISPSVILLRQIDEVFFENCGKLQEKILAKLVDIVTDCEIGAIVIAANKTVRRIKIDAGLVVDELRKMSLNETVTPGTKRTRLQARRRSEMLLINRREWKRGITILEFIQQAENIVNEELLVKVLFDLLRVCLNECEAEPSASVEYTNQLVLSTIHRLAKKLSKTDAHEQVQLISQCIRTSHNPQTHHHALVVLIELFKVSDVDLALHNIMPIFTFMGNSVLRQDDAYSIQIISKIIETVVPTILRDNNEINACTILRIFIVSLPDIPEHRRVPLFVKLLELMEKNLYLFYLIMFECHVKVQQNCQEDVSPSSSSFQRLEFALTISQEFSPSLLIHVCVKLVEFLRNLPVEIDDSIKKYATSKKHIFDLTNCTPKQLRHYKYTIVQFLSVLMSSLDFINRVAVLDAEETKRMIPHYNDLMIQVIMMIESASKSSDVHQGKPKGKYWKVLAHNLYDVLDGVNRLLPNDIFIISMKKLINPRQTVLMVRRKAIEFMNIRLQQRKFSEDDRDQLLTLINPLLTIVMSDEKILKESASPEVELIQQTSVIALKLLAKSWANECPDEFQPVLAGLTAKLNELKDGPLLGSIVLGVAELCGTMRTHSIKYINQFVPAIVKLLHNHCSGLSPLTMSTSSSSSVFIVSIVTALQKIVESMGNFLSLYLDQIVLELCRSSCLYNVDLFNINDSDNRSKIGLVATRIQATSVKLSSSVPLRVLLPAVEKTFKKLMKLNLHRCIGPLMGILAQSFNHVTGNDVGLAISDIGQLFLKVLQFREEMTDKLNSDEDKNNEDDNLIVEIEDSVGKAIVSLVLKLSEATFRPFYYKLYDWAARNDGEHKERNITFYRTSCSIAEALKSLFVLFAGHFLHHSALLLTHNMTVMNGDDADVEKQAEYRLEDESGRVELVDAILMTLCKVFSYDAQHFVNKARFEILAGPIVDQIENTMGSEEDHERRAQELIIPCVGAFVSAIQDDSLHKQVVYQILLKTRHAEPHVRRTGLGALLEIARKLGEDFMPLLSETIPFIAELLEDEDECTEKAAQNAVRTLEEILGEPLQKYF